MQQWDKLVIDARILEVRMPTKREDALLAGVTIQPPDSTAMRVADALREKILGGDLPPGTQLREVHLSAAMNVSRNTVREALRLLASEALTRHTMHRGVVVAQLQLADIVDIFRVRRLLELQALDQVATASKSDLAPIQAAAKVCDEAIDAGAWWEVVRADLAFHEALVGLLDSTRLTNCMRSSVAELRLALATVDRTHGGMPELIHQHRQIIRVAANGEIKDARRRLEKHLDDAERLLLELTPTNGDEPA